MDVTEALGRVKGLLMIAADRRANGDDDGAAAAALMIVDALNEGNVQASDVEAAIAGGAAEGLESEVDAFTDSMSGDEEEEEGPETEEDDAVEESNHSPIAAMKAKALDAIKK